MDVLKIKVNNDWVSVPAIQGPQGQQGPAGQDGAPGQDGSAATIAVGTVTTGNPGTSAIVTNSGTSSVAVFDFTIPRGADGQSGASTWSEVANKPFDTIGTGLEVDSEGALNVTGGGGGADIDNKTIVTNQTTGKAETAIGGYYYEGYVWSTTPEFNPATSITKEYFEKICASPSVKVNSMNSPWGVWGSAAPCTTSKTTEGTVTTYVFETDKSSSGWGKYTLTGVYDSSGDSWSVTQVFSSYSYSYTVKLKIDYQEIGQAIEPIKTAEFIPYDSKVLDIDSNDKLTLSSMKWGTASSNPSLFIGDYSNASHNFGVSNGLFIGTGNNQWLSGTGSTCLNATAATGTNSLAVGKDCLAYGNYAISIGNGQQMTSSGSDNIGIGHNCLNNTSTHSNTIMIGSYLNSSGANCIVLGKYNDNTQNNLFTIGDGTSNNNKHNAFTIDFDGNVKCNNIPAPPSGDGTYNLQCTISSGVATYTWVAV